MTDTPHPVWGFRSDPQAGRPRSLEQSFALVAGVGYVGIGAIGFLVTGFNAFAVNTEEALFGLFGINPFHNIVHLGVGAMWLLAALLLDSMGAEGVNFGIAGVYVLAAVLGFAGYLEVLSISAGLAPDNFLHLLTGAITLAFAGPLRAVRGEPVPV